MLVFIMVTVILAAAFGPAIFAADEAPTFPLSGKVTMPDGGSAAGAFVEARRISRYTECAVAATATSGPDGEFTMQLKRGDYRLHVVLGGFVYFDSCEMISAEYAKPIEMSLRKGCRVQGSVVDTLPASPRAASRSSRGTAITRSRRTWASGP